MCFVRFFLPLIVDGFCPGKYLIWELDDGSDEAWYVVTLAATDENATGSRTRGRSGGGGVSSTIAVAGTTSSTSSSSDTGVSPLFRF